MKTIKGKLMPIRDHVIVEGMDFGEQKTKGGLIIRSDDGRNHGIKPRWAKVYAVGPEQKDVKVGEWLLVEHGRWTRGIKLEEENGDIITIRRVDFDAMLMVSDEKPSDVYIGLE